LPTKTQSIESCAGKELSVNADDSGVVQPALFAQPESQTPFADDAAIGNQSGSSSAADSASDPCAALTPISMRQVDISIAAPDGQFPTDHATSCWTQVQHSAGPCATRDWASSCYHWDATCLCHRPLYFEQINLERYGYGCCESLQPLASAAHFFGTVPALPYCMAVDCPGECIYTLGHYRPGGCPPWRYHCPPFDPLAVFSAGGVWTGMVFLIP
jgi:hypothetical protein